MKNKYILTKDLTPSYSPHKNRVGLYENAQGDRVVIKQCDITSDSTNARFLKSEARTLKSLTSHSELKKIVPTFISWTIQDNVSTLITKEVRGTLLESLVKEERKTVIVHLYEKLKNKDKIQFVQKRNPLFFIPGIVVNTIRAMRKDNRNFGFYLKMMVSFVASYVPALIVGVSYSLAHRDLWPDNILYSNKSKHITILDWESAVITDSLYDLAQIAMIYYKDFKPHELILFLKNNLENDSERKRFISLAIYNTMHTLGVTPVHHPVFMQTRNFLKLIKTNIAPNLMYKKSPFEIVNGITLNLIWQFYSITKLNIVDKKNKIILCYHSVGNDGWRFSTRIEEFRSHIAALKKHYRVQDLNTLLNTTGGGVHISFDDGYKNLITNALPILNKEHVTATLFALGKPSQANRLELDNTLPLLTSKGLKMLHKNGWEIGFHTSTHPYLPSLSPSELKAEIVDGKEEFEEKLKIKINYFAYPKGKYSELIQQQVKKAGYMAAFSVDGKSASMNSNVFLIDRVPVSGELTDRQLLAMISPMGLKISQLFLKVLQLKEQFENYLHKTTNINIIELKQASS